MTLVDVELFRRLRCLGISPLDRLLCVPVFRSGLPFAYGYNIIYGIAPVKPWLIDGIYLVTNGFYLSPDNFAAGSTAHFPIYPENVEKITLHIHQPPLHYR